MRKPQTSHNTARNYKSLKLQSQQDMLVQMNQEPLNNNFNEEQEMMQFDLNSRERQFNNHYLNQQVFYQTLQSSGINAFRLGTPLSNIQSRETQTKGKLMLKSHLDKLTSDQKIKQLKNRISRIQMEQNLSNKRIGNIQKHSDLIELNRQRHYQDVSMLMTHKELVEQRRKELKQRALSFKKDTQNSLNRVKSEVLMRKQENAQENKQEKYLQRQNLAMITQQQYQAKKKLRDKIFMEKTQALQQKSISEQQYNSMLDSQYHYKMTSEIQEKLQNDRILRELEQEEALLIANLQHTIRKEQQWIEKVKEIEQPVVVNSVYQSHNQNMRGISQQQTNRKQSQMQSQNNSRKRNNNLMIESDSLPQTLRGSIDLTKANSINEIHTQQYQKDSQIKSSEIKSVDMHKSECSNLSQYQQRKNIVNFQPGN